MLTLIIACFTSCSDDDSTYGTVTFTKTGLYVNTPGGTATTTFTTSNVSSLSVYSYPDGWDVTLSFGKRTVSVTAPTDITSDDVATSGKVKLAGETPDGSTVYGTFYVGIVEFEDIEDEQANSMIVSEPNKIYIFNATFKGEESMGEAISGVASCDLLWTSVNVPVAHVQLISDTQIAFYTQIDEDDVDEDGDTTDLIEGNAIIAVRNSSDDILWSWHIWVTESEPVAVAFSGAQFMDRNLGAAMNSVDSDDDVMSSYGLYYQWGRKDPFIYVREYNAAGGEDGYMVNDYGTYLSIDYEETTKSIGTVDYAIENPLSFLLGVDDSDQDWIYSNHNATLWSDSSKSVYDPSPKGWRVPSSADFAAISLGALPADQPSYGMYLADGTGAEVLFMGLGRRSYLSGRLENVNTEYDPWTGYYWTSTAASDDNKSKCLKFSNIDYIDYNFSAQRANAMQIRCVKE